MMYTSKTTQDSEYRRIEKQFRKTNDLSQVLDLDNIDTNRFKVEQVKFESLKITKTSWFNLPPIQKWKVFTLKNYPGFYIIRELLTPEIQRYIIQQALETYCQPPNITNLNLHYGEIKDLWKNAIKKATPKPNLPSYEKLLEKLAWCTLGYQYDWTNRKYDKNAKAEFPKDISELIEFIANVCGWKEYTPEAAIINYYSKLRSMGGHLDNAEYDMR